MDIFRRLFSSATSAQSPGFDERRQQLATELGEFARGAIWNQDQYDALSDYVLRFQAIKDEVFQLARASYDEALLSSAKRRHKEVEDQIDVKKQRSPVYKTACETLEGITERLWRINKEEFELLASKRRDMADVVPGPLIWGPISDALTATKQMVDDVRR